MSSNYVCSGCNKRGAKLWRETHVKQIKLKCAECLGVSQQIDQDGKVLNNFGARTDKVGAWIPAVPIKEEDDGFWGYLSIPDADFKWWRSLK